jgi:hypothetical protein
MENLRFRKGTTLVELMVACAIFSALAVSVFSILRYGTRNWRSIESRNSVQVEIRKAEFDLNKEVSRTALSTLIAYPWTGVTDYRHALLFQTAADLEGIKITTDENGNLQWQRWLLYYIIRPPGDTCAAPGGTDNICPHKWLVKKDIALAGISSPELLVNYLNTDLKTKDDGGNANVLKASILSRDILSFNIDASTHYPEVLLTIKCFKQIEYQGFARIGLDNLETEKATIQVDNRIIPRNK